MEIPNIFNQVKTYCLSMNHPYPRGFDDELFDLLLHTFGKNNILKFSDFTSHNDV